VPRWWTGPTVRKVCEISIFYGYVVTRVVNHVVSPSRSCAQKVGGKSDRPSSSGPVCEFNFRGLWPGWKGFAQFFTGEALASWIGRIDAVTKPLARSLPEGVLGHRTSFLWRAEDHYLKASRSYSATSRRLSR